MIMMASLRPTCRALESLSVRRSGEGIVVRGPAVGGHLGCQETEDKCGDDGDMAGMLHDALLMVIRGELEYLFGLTPNMSKVVHNIDEA